MPTLLLALLTASVPAAQAETLDAIDARLMARLGEFVSEGTAPGQSLVASHRIEATQLAKWGDATIALGWYTGVLALERHLLAARGDDPAPTDARLALALGALERIDRTAETGFAPPCASYEDQNGFFVRDDVPSTFHEYLDGITSIGSDWTNGNEFAKEESQDQVHHLLVGLTLVKRFVPPEVTVDGVALVGQATDLGVDMLTHLADHEWAVRNPACDDKLVARGPSAIHASPGLAGVGRYLTDGAVELAYPEEAETLWTALSAPNNITFNNPDNRHMTMATGATGKGWGDDTFDLLAAMAEPYAWTAYPLLHAALYGADPLDPDTLTALLDTSRAHLAELDGVEPHRPDEATVAYGWTSWQRYIRPIEKHYVGGDGEAGRRYNGLDWLMLHRLVQVVEADLADGVPDTDVPGADTDTDADLTTDRTDGCEGCATGAPPSLAWLLATLLWRRRRGNAQRRATGLSTSR